MTDKLVLPKYKIKDYKIFLILEKLPEFKLIHVLFYKKLKIVREYLAENYKKGFI